MRSYVAAALAVLVLSGCKTTEEAAQSLQSRWIGQSADAFFVQNGAPESDFPRDNGGHIYTWRGGQTSTMRPAQWQQQKVQQPNWQAGRPGQPATTTYSYPVMVQPARRVEYYCEAQIVTDPAGRIESVRINRDTDGVGLSFSRCAELFAEE